MLGGFHFDLPQHSQHPTVTIRHVQREERDVVVVLELVFEGQAIVVLLAIE
jgi:hypothetical protein